MEIHINKAELGRFSVGRRKYGDDFVFPRRLEPKGYFNTIKGFGLYLQEVEKEEKEIYLYRPEIGIKLTLDQRIPKPQEIYRDCLYYEVGKSLGFDISLPTFPWRMEKNDKGVLRPYIEDARGLEVYELDKYIKEYQSFFINVAIMDYICGVVDRNSRDIIFSEQSGLWVVDSGLSFVEGEDFNCQSSVIRNKSKGKNIPTVTLKSLLSLKNGGLDKFMSKLLTNNEIESFQKRANKLLDLRVIQ